MWAGLAAAMVLAAPGAAQGATEEAAVRQLVDRFEAARTAFDPAALAATLAPDFEEISPLGQVDARDAVLGFYQPDKKSPAPPLTSDETAVRVTGDTALVTRRTGFTIPNGPTRSIRVRYVARRTGRAWQLVSAQYTPMPSPR
jgi:uncharacterized protein (TIGR02246 family)